MLRNESPDCLLEHPLRAAIVDEVRSRPGISFLQLGESVLAESGRSPLGHGTVSHHLHHLERARLLVSRRAGRHRRFFLPQHARAAPRLSFSWDPVATRLLELVAANPGLDQTQLAQTMGKARPNLARILTRLYEAGLVRRARMGRALQYWPAPAGGNPQPSLPETIRGSGTPVVVPHVEDDPLRQPRRPLVLPSPSWSTDPHGAVPTLEGLLP